MGMALGAFELLHPLGRGGMAEVWAARHVAQGLPVAVKVVTARRARDPEFVDALRAEVRAVAGLDHPHVVHVFDQGIVDPRDAGAVPQGSPYLVMEIARDGNLRSLCGRIGWDRARAVLIALLEGLAHAHARGVVHRDLKPGNVLLDGDRVLLSDFGLAVAPDLADGTSSPHAPAGGTPAYMAPEQILGRWRDFGPHTDLYALGCVAWKLATGRAPFAGEPARVLAAQLRDDPPAFEPTVPVPRGFEDWARTLLVKDPSSRVDRAATALTALLGLGPAEGDAAPPPVADPEAPTIVRAVPTALPASFGDARAFPPPPLPTAWSDGSSPTRPSMRLVGAGLALWGLRTVGLVDREAERDRLWQRLRAVATTGRTAIVRIEGAAGYGKSRLAQWIGERAHEVGAADVLRATHGPSGGPHDGLVAMVGRHLRCADLDGEALRVRVTEALSRGGAADEALIDAVVGLLRPREGATAAERHGALHRALGWLARVRPLVLWVDDAQWGADAVAFCRHLRGAAPLPLLVLVTVQVEALVERPATRAALDELGADETITVGPLPASDRADLIRGLLGLEGGLAARIEERTAGNPLFAVQLVDDWVQRGLLVPGERGFRLSKRGRVALPDDVHAVWRARVDRVLGGRPPFDEAVLEIAATLGQEVDRDEWHAACGALPPGDLLPALLDQRLAVPTEAGWAFVHGMLRESLLRRAADAERLASHHGACAEALAARKAAPERIGPHLLAAGRADDALRPLLDGAIARTRAGDLGEALELLDERERAMKALSLPASDPRWGDGWLHRAAALRMRGDYADALGVAIRAEEAARRHDWRPVLAGALVQRARATWVVGNSGLVRQMLREAEAVADAAGDVLLRGHARHDLAGTYETTGEPEAATPLMWAALVDMRAAGYATGCGGCELGLGRYAERRGDLRVAAAHFGAARAWYEQAGFKLGVGLAAAKQGDLALALGRAGEAERLYEEALAALDAVRTPDVVLPLLALGTLHAEQGRWEGARELLVRALALLEPEATRRPHQVVAARAVLLACQVAAGDMPGADETIEALRARTWTGPLDDRASALVVRSAALARAAGDAARADAIRDLFPPPPPA